MIPNRCIIVASGASVRQGMWDTQVKDLPLWKHLNSEFTLGANWLFKYYTPTALLYIDHQFYIREKENLSSLPLVFGLQNGYYSRSKLVKSTQFETFHLHNNIYLLPHRKKEDENGQTIQYHSINSWQKGFVAGLTGIMSLNLAIACGCKEIYLCYDKETEVFTNEGWKFFKNLTGKELVLTRKSNGYTEWSEITDLQQYKYDGIMKNLKCRGLDLLVTPEHMFYLESNKDFQKETDGYIHKRVKDFNTNDYKIPKTFKWTGKQLQYFRLPKVFGGINNKTLYPEKKIKIEWWLKFLGLYIAEGCCEGKKGHYRIIIYQNHNLEKDNYINNILSHLPFHYKKTKRGWNINNKQLSTYLGKNTGKDCYTKHIPFDIKNLSKKNLKYLLEGLMFGDGHDNKKRGTKFYFTTSKQLMIDVQEIAYKCGYYASISMRNRGTMKITRKTYKTSTEYTVIISKSKKQGNGATISIRDLVFKNKIINVPYNDYVYDLTAKKNHVIWVKRHNKCVWSGNCGFDATDTEGRTHFYEDEMLPTGKNEDGGDSDSGIGKDNSGRFKTSVYNGGVQERFEVFKDELKRINIYNVSLNSKIDTFPKISYEEFYKQLKNNSLHLSQDDIRKSLLKTYNENCSK